MAPFFSRERFGVPQIVAASLLLLFAAQCAYFVANVPLTQIEANYVRTGMEFQTGRGPAGDVARSPLTGLLASLPLRVIARDAAPRVYDPLFLDAHRWWIRAPFLFAGVMLGASLWYVARRLYGNTGGYIALGLYAFNPAMVARSGLAQPDVFAAWGAFGAVFTAIAVAHTLYAPREVVLWNWRRILLLGFCVLLMFGAEFSTAPLMLLALTFMLWAVPERRGAALLIWSSACLVALTLLSSAYLFRLGIMGQALASARWLAFAPPAQGQGAVFALRMLTAYLTREAAAPLLLFLVAVVTYLAWKRARFFGNTAPLLVALALVGMWMVAPGDRTFLTIFLVFGMVFSAGVLTDALESTQSSVALGAVLGVVLTQAVLGAASLLQIGSRR